MSNRKLIGRVSATEKYPSSCDDFQFWLFMSRFMRIKIVR